MILGIGVDATPIARIKRILESPHSSRFLARVFSDGEIEYGFKGSRPAERLAGIFAAKEATAKALGTGFSRGVHPGGISVTRSQDGVPGITLSEDIIRNSRGREIGTIFLSITHTDSVACAFVVIEESPD